MPRNIISIVKPSRCTEVSNLFYFGMTLFHVSVGLSVHHQEFKNLHTATDIFQTDTTDCLVRHCCMFASKQTAVSVWHTSYVCCCMQILELLMVKQTAVSVSHMSVAVCKVLNSWWSSSQQYLFDKCLLLYVNSWTPDGQAVSSFCLTNACCCM